MAAPAQKRVLRRSSTFTSPLNVEESISAVTRPPQEMSCPPVTLEGNSSARHRWPGSPCAPQAQRWHCDTIGRRRLPMSGNFDRLCGSGRQPHSLARPNVT
jgi:hypothetical protein